MGKNKLYLIVSADYLETAFFCGTSNECAEVLGMPNRDSFHVALAKGSKVMNFFRIERVPEEDKTVRFGGGQ